MAVRLILLGALAGAALAIGIESFRLVTTAPGFSAAGNAPYGPTLLLAAGWAAVAAGLLQLWRFPTRRSGALLVAAGLALFVVEWDNPTVGSSVVFSTGLLLTAAEPAVVAHLALCFPSGRANALADRAVVATGYAINVGLLGLAVAATFDPTSSGCSGCPKNLLLVDNDAHLSSDLVLLGLRLGIGWSAVAAILLAWRLISSSPARRHTAGPVWTLAIADLVLVAASYRHGIDRGFVGSDVIQARLWVGQAIALLLIAAAAMLALVRSRRSQRTLTRLVIDLGDTTHPGHLRATLAERFADPDLLVAYPVEDGHRYVDADAHDIDLAALRPNQSRDSLTYDGAEIAVLLHKPGILDTPETVGELTGAVHLALDYERLHAAALAQLIDLQTSGSRILTTGDEERRRLERDLHDGAQQHLLGIALALRLLGSKATTGKKDLDLAESQVRQAIAELRQIARGIYPVVLRESGLAVALAALAEHRLLRIGEMPTARYPSAVESTVYLLVALASEHSPTTVSIDEHAVTINVHVEVEHDPPDLSEVRDRTTTLNGHLTVSANEARPHITLVLPIPRAIAPAENIQPRTRR